MAFFFFKPLRKIPIFKVKHCDYSSVPCVSCRLHEPALWWFFESSALHLGCRRVFRIISDKKNPRLALTLRDRVSCSTGQLLSLLESRWLVGWFFVFVVEGSAR